MEWEGEKEGRVNYVKIHKTPIFRNFWVIRDPNFQESKSFKLRALSIVWSVYYDQVE